jgi:hypothetical protein
LAVLGGFVSLQFAILGSSVLHEAPSHRNYRRIFRKFPRNFGQIGLSEHLVLSQPPEYTIFAASLLTPTPFHAVKFGDAPCYYAVIGRVMTLRATNLRTRRPNSAVQGRLAPA